MPDRNRPGYVVDECRWFRDQARGETLWRTLVGWAYYGPLLLLTLVWWALTRLVAVPYALLRWGWRLLWRR